MAPGHNPAYLQVLNSSASSAQPIPTMKSSTKNQAAGIAKTIAGKVKASTGKLVGNPRLEAAGKVDQAEGRVQKKIGEIQQVLNN